MLILPHIDGGIDRSNAISWQLAHFRCDETHVTVSPSRSDESDHCRYPGALALARSRIIVSSPVYRVKHTLVSKNSDGVGHHCNSLCRPSSIKEHQVKSACTLQLVRLIPIESRYVVQLRVAYSRMSRTSSENTWEACSIAIFLLPWFPTFCRLWWLFGSDNRWHPSGRASQHDIYPTPLRNKRIQNRRFALQFGAHFVPLDRNARFFADHKILQSICKRLWEQVKMTVENVSMFQRTPFLHIRPKFIFGILDRKESTKIIILYLYSNILFILWYGLEGTRTRQEKWKTNFEFTPRRFCTPEMVLSWTIGED